ncbi:aldehyde dehydrogenase family protein [Streptomyces sp. NPDC006476]|uniref:aldehyde dehydrogenase family protein n=1 Tax=Streptomyces sp. NPDC006476 TaxID=3157175 RepID=UPI0033A8819C
MGRVGVDVYPLQTGLGLAEVTSFGKYLGGSPTNVAVAAARYGRSAAVITKTGRDPFGDFVRTALDEAIDVINANPYGNGTALFTASGEAARRFQRRVKVGMIGITVPVPMSYYSFGGWKDSLIGDSPIHGPEGIRFYTRPKVVTTRRWPQQSQQVAAGFTFPTSN